MNIPKNTPPPVSILEEEEDVDYDEFLEWTPDDEDAFSRAIIDDNLLE